MWEKAQTVATIVTPIILGIGGFIINLNQAELSSNISRLENTISQVQVMEPYIESILDSSTSGKAETSAYALYMLNRENPGFIVQLSLLSGNKRLEDFLISLSKSDNKVLENVLNTAFSKEGLDNINNVLRKDAMRAKIIDNTLSSDQGWCFLASITDTNVVYISDDFFSFICLFDAYIDIPNSYKKQFNDKKISYYRKIFGNALESTISTKIQSQNFNEYKMDELFKFHKNFFQSIKDDKLKKIFLAIPVEGRINANRKSLEKEKGVDLSDDRPVGYIRNSPPRATGYKLGKIIGTIGIGQSFLVDEIQIFEKGRGLTKKYIIWGNIRKTNLPKPL